MAAIRIADIVYYYGMDLSIFVIICHVNVLRFNRVDAAIFGLLIKIMNFPCVLVEKITFPVIGRMISTHKSRSFPWYFSMAVLIRRNISDGSREGKRVGYFLEDGGEKDAAENK